MLLRLSLILAAAVSVTGCGSESSWVEVARLGAVRADHTATVLPSGEVLVVGGEPSASPYTEVYSPSTDRWRPVANPTWHRFGHDALVLTSGDVLVAGGYSPRWELYEWRSGVWLTGGVSNISMGPIRAALLPSDKVLLVGGESSEVLDPATGAIVAAAPLTLPRTYFSLTRLTSGKILAAGGSNPAYGGSAVAELFDPETGAWTVTASMTHPSFGHTATLLTTGEVLTAGEKTAQLYNPSSGSWRDTGTMVLERSGHTTATLLPNGHVLVAGGNPVSGLTESFDPLTERWTASAPLHSNRRGHAATVLESGEVMLCGGWNQSGQHLASSELLVWLRHDRPDYDPHQPACAGGPASGTAAALLLLAAARRRSWALIALLRGRQGSRGDT